MEFPYCVVDGVEHQLVFSDLGTLRFPDSNPDLELDLNQAVIDYYNGKIKLEILWNYYTTTGSSYDLVEGCFSPYGINNHTVTQGNEPCKNMVLHSGDSDVDSQYNYSADEKIMADVHNTIGKLYDENEQDKDTLISVLSDCINKLKTIEE